MTPAQPVYLWFAHQAASSPCHWQYRHGDHASGYIAGDDVGAWQAASRSWQTAGCDGIVSVSHGGLSRLVRSTQIPLYVCSPRLLTLYAAQPVSNVAPQLRTSQALDALAAICRAHNPPSIGGLRALSRGEHLSYRMCDVTAVEAALRNHPAWPALCQANDDSSATTIRHRAFTVHMLDPRNYVDVAKPDRMAALRSHFCVTPTAMWQLRRGDSTNASRLLDCVGHLFAGPHWLARPQDLVDLPPASNVLLWSRLRDLQNRQGLATIQQLGRNPTKLCRWWLGGAQFYLRFARDVWLDNDQTAAALAQVQSTAPRAAIDGVETELVRERRQQLFVPTHYFPDEVALSAWHTHAAACRVVD